MSTIKILIVEDEPSYALELQMIIDELGYEVLATVDNADEVFKILKTEKPDLILMDIQIKGEVSGIEIAQKIQDEPIGIIYITSFDDKEIFTKAQKTKNFGYIVKPFNHLTLEGAIETALMNTENSNDDDDLELSFNNKNNKGWSEDLILEDCVFIKTRGRLEKVLLDDIRYLESDGNYCMIITKEKKYVLKLSLRKVSEILSTKNFVRVSKSNIVNMKCISVIELTNNRLMLGEQYFLIGRKYKVNVISRLRLLI